MRCWLVVVLAWGCWSKPLDRPQPAVPSPAGLVWSTPRQPFRYWDTAWAIEAAPTGRLLIGSSGRVALIDLATGELLAEREIPTPIGTDPISFGELAWLGGHRWLAMGIANPYQFAFLVEGEQLAVKPLPQFTRKRTNGIPSVARMDDGAVLVTGDDLPLAIYDPQTLALREMLDARHDWANVSAHGNVIVAAKGRHELWQIDRATRQQWPLLLDMDGARRPTSGIDRPRAADGFVVHSRLDNDTRLVIVEGKRQTTLATPVDGFRVDASGRRVVVGTARGLQVWALPSGQVLHELPVRHRPNDFDTMIDRRYIATIDGELRILDLETGSLSPAGEVPKGNTNRVAVDNRGTVVAVGAALWRFEGGRLQATRTGKLVSDLYDGQRWLVQDEDGTALWHERSDRPERRWDDVSTAWIGARAIALQLDGDDDGFETEVVREADGKRTRIATVTLADHHLDVDADAGDAVVGDAVIRVWRGGKPQPYELFLPQCKYASPRLERGGDRVVAWSTYDRAVAVWDRRTGALLGSAKLDGLVGHATFVGNRRELVLVVGNRLVVWTPGGTARVTALAHVVHASASPDGRWLAVAFGESHVALYDFAGLVASLPSGATPAALVMPPTCTREAPEEEEEEEEP